MKIPVDVDPSFDKILTGEVVLRSRVSTTT